MTAHPGIYVVYYQQKDEMMKMNIFTTKAGAMDFAMSLPRKVEVMVYRYSRDTIKEELQ